MTNAYLARMAVIIAVAIFAALLKLGSTFAGYADRDGDSSRRLDIEKWKLANSEIASYDACRSALGTISGPGLIGSYCGCLATSGVPAFHQLPHHKLKPMLIASYRAEPQPDPNDAALARLATAIEAGSTACRPMPKPASQPMFEPRREARITIGGETHTAREWQELARRSSPNYRRGRELPLLAEHP